MIIKKIYSVLKFFQKPINCFLGMISFFLLILTLLVKSIYLFYIAIPLIVFFVVVPVLLVMTIHMIVLLNIIKNKEKRQLLHSFSVPENNQISVRQLARRLNMSSYEAFFVLSLAAKGDRKIKNISKFNYQITE